MDKAYVENLGRQIVDSAYSVHTALGPGLLENVYVLCLVRELELRSIPCKREVVMDIEYKGFTYTGACRLDLLVADCVIVELKSVEKVLPVHEAQLLSYLRLSRLPLGLLINFNVPLIKDGIKRFANYPRHFAP
ncbi:MAG: GxxExxY protein [Pyramidobacter sp.]|nr:GxxExxY protein [Pyramidobacter sp.]